MKYDHDGCESDRKADHGNLMRALQSVQWLQFFVDLVAESPPFYLMHPATAQDGWHGGIHAVRGGTRIIPTPDTDGGGRHGE